MTSDFSDIIDLNWKW